MLNEINLAIVGHANVGKTSLLRTLTQDSQFGTISDKPGSTRHVEAITFSLSNNDKIVFYDTPGLEDSIALYDYISRLNRDYTKADGIDKLNQFLSSPESEHRFEQEAKVIRQLLKSDAAIYVVDIREPILDKYHDELAVLAYSDKPILAVFNYTASSSPYEIEWKKLLSRIGIHTIVRFDAVFPSLDGEYRLYQSLLLLLEPAKNILNGWQEKIKQQRLNRNHRASLAIADALIDVAAYSELAKDNVEDMIKIMQDNVRKREQQAITELLSLYQFSIAQQSSENLPILRGRFESDLFNREALKLMGIHLSKGMLSGAVIGAGVDLAVGGITLGSAALIGATIGGLAQTAKHYGNRIRNKLSGHTKMTIDDAIICFLSLRLLQLKESLNLRGHANNMPIILAKLDEGTWKKGKLPKSLQVTRVHPSWSTIGRYKLKKDDANRQEVLSNVARELE
ncbi:GTPase/DUF3482 domain-containing protein [Orbus sturtevantii]|uniref:GTPase/DUF3482 domain-containing protein n=1 Tax=Orbus sturtevantii TaxID=3074109 RepID=UPI00370D9DEA